MDKDRPSDKELLAFFATYLKHRRANAGPEQRKHDLILDALSYGIPYDDLDALLKKYSSLLASRAKTGKPENEALRRRRLFLRRVATECSRLAEMVATLGWPGLPGILEEAAGYALERANEEKRPAGRRASELERGWRTDFAQLSVRSTGKPRDRLGVALFNEVFGREMGLNTYVRGRRDDKQRKTVRQST